MTVDLTFADINVAVVQNHTIIIVNLQLRIHIEQIIEISTIATDAFCYDYHFDIA
jgi:hypothetical protein